MRKLESMIAQFVGDLLQTIGEATVEDLRELFAGRPDGEKFEATVVFSSPALPGPSVRPELRARAPRGEGREPRRSFPSISGSATASGSSSPPGVAEITDPESLLSLGRSGEVSGLNGSSFSNGSRFANGAPADREQPSRAPSRARARALLDVGEHATRAEGHVEPEASPASSIRPVGNGSTVKLSDNETLARVSNSGVVIRRKKRAQG
jgi:hypothetical protein